jgi:hypothetical protein
MTTYWLDGGTSEMDNDIDRIYTDRNKAIAAAQRINTWFDHWAYVFVVEDGAITDCAYSPRQPHITDHATQTGMYDRL